MKSASDYRKGTKRYVIASLAEAGKSKRETYEMLVPAVTDQVRPMIFSANVNGSRIPKPMSEQFQELKNEIGRVYAILGKSVSADFEAEEVSDDEPAETVEETSTICDDCGIAENAYSNLTYDKSTGLTLCAACLARQNEEIEEVDDTPKAKGKNSVKAELAYFLRRIREIRAFCTERAERSEPIDELGVRPSQAAAKLILAGIPANALLAAMTFHWPRDARNDAGIADFDFIALSRKIAKEREIDMAGKHVLFPYVLTLCEERIPVMLVGPMGSGKSHIARQVAEFLEVPYGETALSAGATRGDLLGRLTANNENPFILSKFCEIYSGGGVFNFEEIDAALPEVLITLNNALSSNRMFNSANGEEYDRHADFIPFSTANTWGTGANRQYVARERLDAATIDRWRMGRVFVPLDETIEEEILFGRL
jgi:hypothetical protein